MVAVTSDQHAGSTVALCPPTVDLDDGGRYEASKAQQWVWQCWEDFWKTVEWERKKHDASLYTVFNGDLTEGNHHGTTQILSGNPTAQAAVVNKCMGPVLDLRPDAMFFVRGTEAHVGKSAAYEERIALGLRKDGHPVVGDTSTGTASHWHLKMEVLGVRFDFAHHGRFGQRPWTRGNVVLNQAAEIFYDHAAEGRPHPHLAIRSHQHRFFDTHNAHPTRVVQTPAWQLATAFIHRINPGAVAHIGGIIVVIDEGHYEVRPVLFTPAPTEVWRA